MYKFAFVYTCTFTVLLFLSLPPIFALLQKLPSSLHEISNARDRIFHPKLRSVWSPKCLPNLAFILMDKPPFIDSPQKHIDRAAIVC